MKLYIATSNPGKLRDFAAAAFRHVKLIPLPGINEIPAPAEDQPTFDGNARLKAIYYSHYASGEIVIADDSGLEVDALGGAPGVRSARYAADEHNPDDDSGNSDDADNNARLLRELHEVPDEFRNGRFVFVIAAARNGHTLETFHGKAEGMILRAPRGV